MSALLKFELAGYWVECANCGITFGMTEEWNNRLRKTHATFYCPSGHTNVYSGLNDTEKLRKELEAEKARREQAERDAEWQKSVARNARTQETKAKNKLKKVETRINAGVCPHCNRTFKQLAAHMKCKHADVVGADEAISA